MSGSVYDDDAFRCVHEFLLPFSNLAVNDKHTLLIMKEMTSACQQNQACFKLDPFDKLALH